MGKLNFAIFFIFMFNIASWSQLSFSGIETISVSGSFKSSPSPAPCFTDWNGDGKTDLLAGVYFGDGDSKETAIQLYLNNGTNSEPQYQYSEKLKSGGIDIQPYFY